MTRYSGLSIPDKNLAVSIANFEMAFKDEGHNLEVTLKEKGEMVLKLKSKKLPLNRSSKLTFYTYSIKDRVVMRGLIEG